MNLGQLCLPEEKWKTLANCIEGFLANQKTFIPVDQEIEAKARHYASQIRHERLSRGQECLVAEEASVKDVAYYEHVDVNSLITSDAKTVGAEHVVISHMNEYGFDKIVKGLEFTQEQITYSNFEGSKRGSKIARHGKTKERRNDCPIITLSLTINEDGFPKQSKVWEGNVSEPDTLKDILSGLKKEGGLFSHEKTIVLDAGIATEENIALTKKSGYAYVVVSRKKSYEDDFWSKVDEEKIPLSDGKTTLSMKLVRTEEESFLLCHSEAKEVKEKAILFLKEQRFEQADGNVTELQCAKNEQAQAKEGAVGTYVLRTNRLDLGREEISKLHRSLTTIEECFENMKGDLGLRPNFHHTDVPTIAHAHVTVLAYHILAGILKKLRTAGIHYDWNTIRNILATHVRVTTTMNTEDGHVIDVRTCTAPTEKQHMIYHKLHIQHTPLGRKYLKSSMKNQRCSAEK